MYQSWGISYMSCKACHRARIGFRGGYVAVAKAEGRPTSGNAQDVDCREPLVATGPPRDRMRDLAGTPRRGLTRADGS